MLLLEHLQNQVGLDSVCVCVHERERERERERWCAEWHLSDHPVLLVSPFRGMLGKRGNKCVGTWLAQLWTMLGELSAGQQRGSGC